MDRPIKFGLQPTDFQLPQPFSRHLTQHNGTTSYKFEPELKLPWSDKSLEEFMAIAQTIAPDEMREDITFSPYSDLKRVVDVVLQEVAKDFIGLRGFYELSLDYWQSDNPTDGIILRYYHHIEGHQAWFSALKIKVTSCSDFYPVIQEGGVERPTISEMEIRGTLSMRVSIQKPDNANHQYGGGVVTPIIAALLFDEDITLGENERLESWSSPFLTVGSSIGMLQIRNPTFQRMEEALGYVDQIDTYVQMRKAEFQNIAAIVEAAREMERETKPEVEGIYSRMVDLTQKLNSAAPSHAPEFTLPKVDPVIQYIDEQIPGKLAAADELLEPIRSDFPRAVEPYAATKVDEW